MTSKKTPCSPKTATAIVCLLALFALLCLQRFDAIHGQDEISHYMKLTRLLFHSQFANPNELITFSPHLYPLSTWGISNLLGDANSFSMRLTGLLYWLATLGSAAWLCRNARPILALALCILAPVSVAATTIVEIDQAIMPAFTLLLVSAAAAWLQPGGRRLLRAACVSLVFCLCLWCRLSTPLALIPLLTAAAWLHGRSWRRAAAMLAMLAVGMALFATTWFLYGRLTGIRWQGIYDYLIASFRQTTIGERSSGAARLCISAVMAVIWGMPPAFIALLAAALWSAYRQWRADRTFSPSTLYALCAAWLLLAFTAVGGALFGFPKYQVAAYPLAFIAIALHLRNAWKPLQKADAWRLALFCCLAFAAAWFFIQDPILTIRIDLREAVAEGGSVRNVILPLAARMLAGHGIMLIAAYAAWKAWRLPATALLIAAGLCVNAALLCRQSMTDMNRAYMYGDQGDTQAVAQFLNDNGHDIQHALVPHEVLEVFKQPDLTYRQPFIPTTPQALLAQIEREHPQAIALSFLTSPPATVRNIMADNQLQNCLDRLYDHRTLGRYELWIRRK